MMRTALLLLLTSFCASCQGLQSTATQMHVDHYFADQQDVENVRRILVLPLHVDDEVQVDDTVVRDALVRELSLLQRFRIETVPEDSPEYIAIHRAFERGDVSLEGVVGLAQRYKIDGIVVSRLASYRPYLPPHISLEARLFSLHSGNWVWAADATFDSDNIHVQRDLEHYAASALRRDDTLEGARMVMLSPRRFVAYACHRLVGTWR